jgi:integrase
MMKVIDGFKGQFKTRCALKLSPLLFVRPGEFRRAEWSEISFDKAVWSIPAEKLKMANAHLVPLARQALEIFIELQGYTGAGKYCFPGSHSRERPMSENTVNGALRRLGYSGEEMVAHGFRSTAPTNLNEQGWRYDVIERQLAHVERSESRRPYNKAEYLKERIEMMQAW